MALRDSIKRHLKLPHGYVMEYKPHDASLKDNSSYRNTWLRG
jgi:translation initiation factor 4E